MNMYLAGLMPSPTLSQRLGRAIAATVGWKVEIQEPPPAKCVIIAAPHTSNWDLMLTFLFILASGLRLRWVGKDTLFRGPFDRMFRKLGGIPVNRRVRENFVEQMVAAFRSHETLRLAIVPEGTRRAAPHWKTGFYYIALGAGVPIVLGYDDYRRKVVGLGPTIHPSGDIHADLQRIRAFYAGMVGKHPERQGPIEIRGA